MGSITINLSEGKLERLQELATRFGLSVEDLTRLSIENLVAAPDQKFEHAAEYILKKNEELYSRLSTVL